MKNMILMLVSGMMGVLTLAIVMTIFGNVNRRAELQSNLSAAMEMTLERRMEESSADGISPDMSALAECIQYMAAAMDADTGMTVKVYLSDMEKGVLSMKAIADYRHPNGSVGSAEWDRTVIYNRKEPEKTEQYEVSFYRNKTDMLGEGICYKSIVVREGDRIHPPAEPAGAGADFAGWRDINDYMADFSCPVEQKLTYYADWE